MEQQSALCGCLSVRCPISHKILENLFLLKFFLSRRTFARSVKHSLKYAISYHMERTVLLERPKIKPDLKIIISLK